MVKKKLAFVDHNFHKKTRCADFLREIFSEHFIIDDYWWSLSEEIKLIKYLKNYENIFFFQILMPSYDLLKLRDKNLMWAPMYDALNFRNSFFESIFWKQMSSLGIKVLKFSDKIVKSIKNEDIESLKLNYFIKPSFSFLANEENKMNI